MQKDQSSMEVFKLTDTALIRKITPAERHCFKTHMKKTGGRMAACPRQSLKDCIIFQI